MRDSTTTSIETTRDPTDATFSLSVAEEDQSTFHVSTDGLRSVIVNASRKYSHADDGEVAMVVVVVASYDNGKKRTLFFYP